MTARPGPPCRIWRLETEAGGDNAQLRLLAETLGGASEGKRLVFNRWHVLRNPVLGASVLTLDRRRSDLLAAPWPDLVLSAGRHTVPVARWIRRQTGGRARLVHLGRIGGPPAWFDLVLTPPQFGVPARPNVVELGLPLNRIPEPVLAAAAEQWRPRLAHVARPWIAFFVGGPTVPFGMDAATGEGIAAEVQARARATGGSVLATTSRRTPPPVAAALASALLPSGWLHCWRPAPSDNPYPALLALADEFVVTADSASMLAEACQTGRPVAVARLPVRRRLRVGMNRWVSRRWPAAYARLVEQGVLLTVTDFDRLHAPLRAAGRIRFLGEPIPAARPAPVDDLPRAVAAIRAVQADGRRRPPDRAEPAGYPPCRSPS